MKSFCIDDLHIILNKQGADEYSKVSYPSRYGIFSEIITPDFIFQLNLNGEIKFITGRGRDWPDPSEYLKRTVDNNWIYYSTGGYSGVYDSFGEYYLPCPSYPSNTINLNNPLQSRVVRSAINAWHETHERLSKLNSNDLHQPLKNFLHQVINRSPKILEDGSSTLINIIGDRVTVLPPDTRHVDYNVIPVIVADGCLYKCQFCMVKSQKEFSCRSKDNIQLQINHLKDFYKKEIRNYNAIFLAQHDALNAGDNLLEYAAQYAYEIFCFKKSNLRGAYLFLFGSVDSILNASSTLFNKLEELPFLTYINIGLESVDEETLASLKKNVSPKNIDQAFMKMLDINRRYSKIEVTANFIFGDNLPKGHLPAYYRLMEKRVNRPYGKGAIYFSPLMNEQNGRKRGIKRAFYKIKAQSRLPTFLYLIQKL